MGTKTSSNSFRLTTALLALVVVVVVLTTTTACSVADASPVTFSGFGSLANVTTLASSPAETALHREMAAFFLDHYSLGACAEAITRNNSCPGADLCWNVTVTSVDELKETCTSLATFNHCLRRSICQSCADKSGSKSKLCGKSAVSYYCAKVETPSVLAVCQTMVALSAEQSSSLLTLLLISSTIVSYAVVFLLLSYIYL